MTHDRRFRFGVQTSTATSGEEWAALARQVEDLGYATLFLPDHFGDQLAPVPALMAAAAATTTLRVGALVFDNDYKHPVVLAKEMATIDVLSGGRLEIGLGAGWMTTDYEQSGIPYDTPSVRVDRFEEGLAVITGPPGPRARSPSRATHYQRHRPWTACPSRSSSPARRSSSAAGLKRMLTLAGRHADIVGINPTIPNGEVDAEAARVAAPPR